MKFRIEGKSIIGLYAGARLGAVFSDTEHGGFMALADRTVGRGETPEEATLAMLNKKYPRHLWV